MCLPTPPSWFSCYQVIIKDINEQPGGEAHRERSGKVLGTGVLYLWSWGVPLFQHMGMFTSSVLTILSSGFLLIKVSLCRHD